MSASYLQYNGYAHAVGSTMFTIQRRTLYGRTGRRKLIDHDWSIRGFVQGTDPVDILTPIDAVEAAYVPGGDLTFYTSSGTPSHHTLTNAACLSGTQLRSFAWLGATQRGSGVEHVYRRSFAARIGGLIDPGGQDSSTEFWTETVQRIGDGSALNVWQESLAGTPIAQTVMAHPKHVTIQQGTAIGLTTWPNPNAPIWGAPYYISRLASVSRTTPTYVGVNGQRFYATHWRYEFHSDAVLTGDPTVFS
jgi:hypothetical protein